jgi:hypothetical protein
MSSFEMVVAHTPVHITHDTYKRECRYTRGIHIPLKDFENILQIMCQDTKAYFEFHNVAKPIREGSFLNGHAGLAKVISAYYLETYNERIHSLQDGRDFYVKII